MTGFTANTRLVSGGSKSQQAAREVFPQAVLFHSPSRRESRRNYFVNTKS